MKFIFEPVVPLIVSCLKFNARKLLIEIITQNYDSKLLLKILIGSTAKKKKKKKSKTNKQIIFKKTTTPKKLNMTVQ